jgi:hypothetical protein
MSVNSLTSNPKILKELILNIESKIPQNTIQSLVNTDNNVIVSVTDYVGKVNLEPNISLNTIQADNYAQTNTISTNAPIFTIQTDTNLLYSELQFTQQALTLATQASSNIIQLTNNNTLNFVGSNLKTNNMLNPFNLGGSNGQLLATDGNNNIFWENQQNGLIKNILTFYQNQNTQSGFTIELFNNNAINGFTIGKTVQIEVSFTFYQTSAPENIAITANLNGTIKTINTSQLITLYHLPRKCIFEFTNTATTQPLTISLVGVDGFTINIDQNDYFSLNINEY